MNYSELINHFWQVRRATRVSAIEADLYYFLLQESSSRGLVDTFECSNRLICGCLDITEKTLIKARIGLYEKGFILFDGGQRKSPIYSICQIGDNCKISSETESLEGKQTGKIPVKKQDNCKISSETESLEGGTKESTKEKEELIIKSSTTSISPSSSLQTQSEQAQTLPLDIPTEQDIVKQVVAVYVTKCVKMPSVRLITDKRKTAVMARIHQHSLATVYEMLNIAANSDFLNGKNNRGWVADFDWLFKPENFVKVIERKYETRTNTGTTPASSPTNVAQSNGRYSFSGDYNPNF